MKKQVLAATILAALVGTTANASENKVEREKCYGIAKAGKNDCAAKDGSTSCAGQAKKDGDKNNWVYLPKGICDKITGGSKA